MTEPVRLGTDPKDKVWGSPDTEPWYGNPERRGLGEVWFKTPASLPLLVKLLFTSDKLSVQVHPPDEYAKRRHDSRGKTEMWHVLRADPGAQVALGLTETISKERLREASVSGEIEKLLNWIPARPGDTFFVPAGTIHAIGGGLTLCEVQQLSDITYRLYDYGRDRPLHLEDGVKVSHCGPHEGVVKAQPQAEGRELLVHCEYFRTERISVSGRWQAESPAVKTLYIAVEGEGLLGGQPFSAGNAFEVAAGSDPFAVTSSAATFLVTAEPVSGPSR